MWLWARWVSGSPENPGAGTPVLYTLGTNPLIIMAVAIGLTNFAAGLHIIGGLFQAIC